MINSDTPAPSDAAQALGFDIESLPSHLKDVLKLTTNTSSPEDVIKDRVFYIVDGKVIFGILLLETQDSFLVGAPSRMIRKDANSEVEIESMYENLVIRILKSSVAIVTVVPHKFKFLLLDYLSENGSRILPDYMTEERLLHIRTIRKEIGNEVMPVITPTILITSATIGNDGKHIFPDSGMVH